MVWRYRGFYSRRNPAAFLLFLVFGTLVMVGIHLSNKWDEQKEKIRRSELSANGKAEIFWKALIQSQWLRAQRCLSQKNALRLIEDAQKSGEEGVVGGLYLLHKGLPPTVLAKSEIKCNLKYRDDEKFILSIVGRRQEVIGGACNIFSKQSFFGMSVPRKETAFPVHFEMIREGNEWKVASFSMHTVRGRIALDQEQGMKLP